MWLMFMKLIKINKLGVFVDATSVCFGPEVATRVAVAGRGRSHLHMTEGTDGHKRAFRVMGGAWTRAC